MEKVQQPSEEEKDAFVSIVYMCWLLRFMEVPQKSYRGKEMCFKGNNRKRHTEH